MARGEREHEFTSTRVSASRLNSYVSCGVAFEKHYVNHEPAEVSGSAALFGNVIHKALENWALDRTGNLFEQMKEAWLSETERDVSNGFIRAYQSLSSEVVRAEHECREKFKARTKKDSKAIHMSGEWKGHPVKKKLDRLLAVWIPKLESSHWRFTEFDPLPQLYNESLVLAKRYEQRYRNHPNALHTEFKFEVPFRGFTLVGYIDSIEAQLALGELLSIDVVDYKTYKKESPGAKDWRQGVFYYVAVNYLARTGQIQLPGIADGEFTVPVRILFDYPRLPGARRVYEMTNADLDQLEKELTMYRNGVDNGVFMPADKGRNPDFCDYPGSCCLLNRGGGCAQPIDFIVEAA